MTDGVDLSNPYCWEHDAELLRGCSYGVRDEFRCPDCGLTWRETLPEEKSTCPPDEQTQSLKLEKSSSSGESVTAPSDTEQEER